MSVTSSRKRPLSPHLQIYRWEINMTTSILHRMSGSVLAVGTVLVAWWLLALANGPDTFAAAQDCLTSPLGLVFLFGWSAALCFHFFSGIKHLLMDIGLFFSVPGMRLASYAVIGLAAVLLALIWI
ncbi:MAG: succinate dehydrogenase, cytochrome b556 subunit [Pseudomonadota bacterium]